MKDMGFCILKKGKGRKGSYTYTKMKHTGRFFSKEAAQIFVDLYLKAHPTAELLIERDIRAEKDDSGKG